MHERFVITPAGADGARPTGVAVVTRANVMRIKELVTRLMIDAAFLDMSHLTDVGIDETMTKIDVAGGADT